MSLSQPDGVIEMAKDSSTMKGAVTLSVGTMGVFNYALYENRIAPVRNIKLINHTDHIIEGLSLKVSTDSGFFKDWQAPLPPLPIKKKAVKLSDPNLIIEGQHLAEVSDAFSARACRSCRRSGSPHRCPRCSTPATRRRCCGNSRRRRGSPHSAGPRCPSACRWRRPCR